MKNKSADEMPVAKAETQDWLASDGEAATAKRATLVLGGGTLAEQSKRGRAAYPIKGATEIRTMLRRLIDQHCLFTAHFGESHRFLITTLLGISDDARDLFFDAGQNESINRRVEESSSLLMFTQLERVELRFTTGRPVRVTYAGAPAFRVAIPAEMIYLQWREFFRLAPPVSRPLSCLIPQCDEQGEQVAILEARILDISFGGLAMQLPDGVADLFRQGSRIEGCRIRLPKGDLLEFGLIIHYVSRVSDGKGQPKLRAGCQFVGLTPSMQSMLQRYVLAVERERIARINGVI